MSTSQYYDQSRIDLSLVTYPCSAFCSPRLLVCVRHFQSHHLPTFCYDTPSANDSAFPSQVSHFQGHTSFI